MTKWIEDFCEGLAEHSPLHVKKIQDLVRIYKEQETDKAIFLQYVLRMAIAFSAWRDITPTTLHHLQDLQKRLDDTVAGRIIESEAWQQSSDTIIASARENNLPMLAIRHCESFMTSSSQGSTMRETVEAIIQAAYPDRPESRNNLWRICADTLFYFLQNNFSDQPN
jgi:hypothetical protein